MAAARKLGHDARRARGNDGRDKVRRLPQSRLQDRDMGDRRALRDGDRRAARAAEAQRGAPLCHPAQRRGRPEGADRTRVAFLHPVGGVDVVVKDHQRPLIAAGGIGGAGDGGVDIGGTVGAGERGVAHRPGHDHRRGPGMQKVQHIGRFLDRVGALGNDETRRPFALQLLDQVRKAHQKRQVDLHARDVDQGPRADLGKVARGGDGGQQILGRESWHDTLAVGARRAGDGAAQCDDFDPARHLNPRRVCRWSCWCRQGHG